MARQPIEGGPPELKLAAFMFGGRPGSMSRRSAEADNVIGNLYDEARRNFVELRSGAHRGP